MQRICSIDFKSLILGTYCNGKLLTRILFLRQSIRLHSLCLVILQKGALVSVFAYVC